MLQKALLILALMLVLLTPHETSWAFAGVSRLSGCRMARMRESYHRSKKTLVRSTSCMTSLSLLPSPTWCSVLDTTTAAASSLAHSTTTLPSSVSIGPEASLMLALFSDSSEGGLPSFLLVPGVFLLGAISAFSYANVVYTPEIIENAQQIRLEEREAEIVRILKVVQDHVQQAKDMEELRKPLEFALNMSLEEYLVAVKNLEDDDDSSLDLRRSFTTADIQLAALLETHMAKSDSTKKDS